MCDYGSSQQLELDSGPPELSGANHETKFILAYEFALAASLENVIVTMRR